MKWLVPSHYHTWSLVPGPCKAQTHWQLRAGRRGQGSVIRESNRCPATWKPCVPCSFCNNTTARGSKTAVTEPLQQKSHVDRGRETDPGEDVYGQLSSFHHALNRDRTSHCAARSGSDMIKPGTTLERPFVSNICLPTAILVLSIVAFFFYLLLYEMVSRRVRSVSRPRHPV
ncbi:hypothetical protein DOTSEDRAFT_74584 [Dothistroma septosporum NZE10]|uniref:Uncharacterized protein n=1 Tax=Dothistroma septosporum (strain NZE10 / CBS 128990) TaxID=675120 RepID=N1PEQ2_DOTSN|nr:hypothetical protein DOTSEDRAFT_74584 [Dothistroma septosporum NZE10]